ncbi:MAG: barstar family protein [Anaerolineae bacterium]
MNRLHDILNGKVMPGVYRFSSVAAQQRVRREVEKAGQAFFYLDGRAFADKAGFLKAAAQAFGFPESYGQNWDAFEEGIRDLEWVRKPANGGIAPKGLVALFDEAGRFAKANPQDWATARDIFENASKEWRERGLPMFVLLRGAYAVASDLDVL